MNQERLQMIEKMLENNPTDSFLNYAAALEFNKNGNTKKAIEIIEFIIKNDPEYLGSYYQLGKLYEQTEQIPKAIEAYQNGKLIAKKQQDNKILNELSQALMLLEEEL